LLEELSQRRCALLGQYTADRVDLVVESWIRPLRSADRSGSTTGKIMLMDDSNVGKD
jgi:hypothetical protein